MRAFSLSLAAPVAALVLASPLMTVACGSDSTGTLDAGSTDGGAVDSAAPVDGSVEGNDCITYTPAEIQGTAAGSFARADEVVRVNLPRTDRGGGLLKVTYEATGVPLNGRIFLGAATEFRAETGDFGDGLGGGATPTIYYRLAGDREYQLGVLPADFDEERPSRNVYKFTYSYQPLADCYEANDTAAAAKRIPTDAPLTASGHAGITEPDFLNVKESGTDWYAFTLAAPRTVTLRATLPGMGNERGGNSGFFTLFEGDGTTEISCEGGNSVAETSHVASTEQVETCPVSLPAGRYLVRYASSFASDPAASAVNVTPPVSWTSPYTFTLATAATK